MTFCTGPCKIGDTQFAASTVNGHLGMFTYERSCKLKEGRIFRLRLRVQSEVFPFMTALSLPLGR